MRTYKSYVKSVKSKDNSYCVFSSEDWNYFTEKHKDWTNEQKTQRANELAVEMAKEPKQSTITELLILLDYPIFNIANRYCKAYDDDTFDSAMHAGRCGLFESESVFENYDPAKGNFSNYAERVIRQAIAKDLRENGNGVILKEYDAKEVSRYKRTESEFECQYGMAPTAEQIAEYSGISLEKCEVFQDLAHISNLSMDEIGMNEKGERVELDIPDPAYLDFEDNIISHVDFQNMIEGLPDSARDDLERLAKYDGNCAEAARELNISRAAMGKRKNKLKQQILESCTMTGYGSLSTYDQFFENQAC